MVSRLILLTLILYLLTVPSRCFFGGFFLLFMFRISHVFLSVLCSLMVTCWERAQLLALSLVYDVFVFLSLSHVVSWIRCGA